MATRPLFFGPLLYFRTVPALEKLSSTLLGAIAQHAEEAFFPSGSPLLRPENPLEAFFVIVEGTVSVTEPDGREETLGPGQAVGFLHLLARSEEGLDARATWDTVTLRVDWDAHLDACERYFPILEAHMDYLARRCQMESARVRIGAPSLGSPSETAERERHGAEGGRVQAALPPSLNLAQKLLALHRSRAFPSASMDALAELARHLEEVRYPAGTPCWSHGDDSGAFLMVVTGELILEGPGGGWLEVFGPGEEAGRFEALAGLPREGSLRANVDTVALRLALDPLLDILEDHSTMAVEFTAGLARELIRLQELGPRPTTPPEIL